MSNRKRNAERRRNAKKHSRTLQWRKGRSRRRVEKVRQRIGLRIRLFRAYWQKLKEMKDKANGIKTP